MAYSRGLCKKDYRKIMYLIAIGQVVEQDLIKQKKLLPGGSGIAQKRNDAIFKKGNRTRGVTSEAGKCLVPNCAKPIRNQRGLCITHHSYAMNLMRRGEATEEDLIRRGLLRPKQIATKPTAAKRVPVKRAEPKANSKEPGFSRKFKAIGKCLVPKCSVTKLHARGLCRNHYAEALKLIKRGRTTEEDLIERKLMLPPVPKEKQVKIAHDVFLKGATAVGKKHNTLCRYPKCTQPQDTRGLCLKHYLYAMRLKRSGKASEEDLVNRKLLSPKS